MQNTVGGDIYIGSGETQAIRRITRIAKALRDEYPGVHYHLYSGNAQDVTERLDKGILDFGILIQPADLSKYDYLNLPDKDTWGVVMRKDSPLAEKAYVAVSYTHLDVYKRQLCGGSRCIQLHPGQDYSGW